MSSTLEKPAAPPELHRSVIFPLDQVEWRDAGDPTKASETTVRGHAAVFNRPSEDLGGFREMLEPGAFRAALRKQPDVRLLLNHDPNFVLARTGSGTLDLREDKTGLHVFAAVDRRISWIEDLRVSMQRGDVDQMSFAFMVGDNGDDWAVADDGTVMRTIRADGVSDLFDTSIVTYPAYTHTDVNMRSLLAQAIEGGRLPRSLAGTVAGDALDIAQRNRAEGGESGSHTGLDERRKRLTVLKTKAARSKR
jgi:Escherichia/Staphylococcus phage prohead protease